ncbi:oligosaccharide flippase family protein [Pseudoalteromonas sp. T1lg65]|uniref:oligosaccharide flippase family protein n=1 Tax=Pseudoalteromonas sp. T1lg65 TaxID=2077101 RepID=UPI003F7A83A5
MKKINVNIFFNIVSTMFTTLSPLIVIPIITNAIGLDLYGEFVAILSLCAVCVVLCDLGFGMFIPKYMNERKLVSYVSSDLLVIFIVVKVVISLLALMILYFLFSYSNGVFLTISLFVFVSNLNPTPLVAGIENYKLLAIASLISKSTLVLVAFLIDYEEYPVEAAMLVQVSMVFITNFILYLFLFRVVKSERLSFGMRDVLIFIKDALGFYFARLAVNILNQGSTYLVSKFVSNEQTAIYSFLNQLYKVGQALLGAVSRVLYTHTLKTKCFNALHRSTVYAVCVIFLLAPIVYGFSDNVGKLVLSSSNVELSEYTLLVLFSLVFVAFSSSYGYPALVSIGKESYAHVGIFISSLSYYFAFVLVVYTTEMTLFLALLCVLFSDFLSMSIRFFFAVKFGIINCFKRF